MWKFTARGHDRTVRNDFKINNSAAEKIFNVWQFTFDSICSTEWISICFKFVWNGGILVKMCHMYHACTYTQIIDLYTMQKTFIHHAIHYSGVYTLYKTYIQCVRFYTLCMNLNTVCMNYTLCRLCRDLFTAFTLFRSWYTVHGPIQYVGSKHCAVTYTLCSGRYLYTV